MFLIDSFAYSNRFLSWHPGEKMAFAAVAMILCLASAGFYTGLAVLLLMFCATVPGAGIPWRAYLKLLTLPAFFLLTGLAGVAITTGANSSEYIFSMTLAGYTAGVTGESLLQCRDLFFKSLGAASCLYFLALTTPMVDVLAVFRKLRLPSLLIEIMTLVYRFIFVLAECGEKTFTSQSSRLGYNNLKNGYRSMGSLLSSLFIKSLYKSRALYTTMASRGYSGQIRVLEPEYKFSSKNIFIITASEVALLAVLLISSYGKNFI